MNERIKQLAIKCGFTAYTGDDGADDESLTKFATLLIKECAALAQPADIAIKRIAEQEHAPGNIITVYGSNPYDYCEQYSTNIDHWVAIAHTALDTETKILDHFGLED